MNIPQRECILVNLLNACHDLQGSPVFNRSLWVCSDGIVRNIVEEGARACAIAMSRLLIWFAPKQGRFVKTCHASVIGLERDFPDCAWERIELLEGEKPIPGDILVWAVWEGTEHIGIMYDESQAISTFPRCGLRLHTWNMRADERAIRKVLRVWRHPHLAEEGRELLRIAAQLRSL